MEFKALRAHWYAILKKQGFQDQENPDHEHSPLRDWHSLRFKRIDPTQFQTTRDFYRGANALLHTHSFETATHRRIWELYTNGLSTGQIVKEIADMEPSFRKTKVKEIILEISGLLKDV